MTRGLFKDPAKKQVWNGSGMAAMAPEQRTEVMKASSAKRKEKNSGWPGSIQKEGQIDTYDLATWEWAKRMANSRKAHWL